VLDFTSALYLGLQHPSPSLRPWHQLTTGVPAALVEPAEAREIGRSLAELQGCEAATLATSTLHLAWDLVDVLAQTPITLFMDAEAYLISRWGAQCAAHRGALVRTFPHHNAAALERELSAAPRGRVPVIVTDGLCPSCGRVAPLGDYLALARSRRGILVADDTQALGVLGYASDARMPYGQGGGGSLRWSGLQAPEALVFSSLAKGFGVPIAVLAGSRPWIRKYEEKSLTRVYCSPPSVATLRAAEHAIEMNRRWGDRLRQRLALLVRRFREKLRALGISASGGHFPVQTLALPPGVDVRAFHRRLGRCGVRSVLQTGRSDPRPRVVLLLTARHSLGEIDSTAAMIGHTLRVEKRFSMTVIKTAQNTQIQPETAK
jgi:8-amino-7-oxononanoate synthase